MKPRYGVTVIATAAEKRQPKMWMTNKLATTVSITFFSLVIVRYLIVNSSTSGISQYQILHTNPLEWFNSPVAAQETTPEAAAANASTSNSLDFGNISPEVFQWLDTWNQMKQLTNITNGLPHASEAINDGRINSQNGRFQVGDRFFHH